MKAQARRLLALIMAMAMCLSLLQGVAFAAEDASVEEEPAVVEVQEAEVEEEEAPQAEEEEAPKAKKAPKAEEADEDEAVVETQDATEKFITKIEALPDMDGVKLTYNVGGTEEYKWTDANIGNAVRVETSHRDATIGEQGWQRWIVTALSGDNPVVVNITKYTEPLTLENNALQWSDVTLYNKAKDGTIYTRKGQMAEAEVYKDNRYNQPSDPNSNEKTKNVYYRLYPTTRNNTFNEVAPVDWVYAVNETAGTDTTDGSGTWVHVNVYGKVAPVTFGQNADADNITSPSTAQLLGEATTPNDIENEATLVATITSTVAAPSWELQTQYTGTGLSNIEAGCVEKGQINLIDKTKAGTFMIRAVDVNSVVKDEGNGPTRFNYMTGDNFDFTARRTNWHNEGAERSNIVAQLAVLTNNGTLKMSVDGMATGHWFLVTVMPNQGSNFTQYAVMSGRVEQDNTRWYTTWEWNSTLGMSKEVTKLGLIDTAKDGTYYIVYKDETGEKYYVEPKTIPAGTKIYGALQVVGLPKDGIDLDKLKVGDVFRTPEELVAMAQGGERKPSWNLACYKQNVSYNRLVINDFVNGKKNGVTNSEEAAATLAHIGTATSFAYEARNLIKVNNIDDVRPAFNNIPASAYKTQKLYCKDDNNVGHDQTEVNTDHQATAAHPTLVENIWTSDDHTKEKGTATLEANPQHTAVNVRSVDLVDCPKSGKDTGKDIVVNMCKYCGQEFGRSEQTIKFVAPLKVGADAHEFRMNDLDQMDPTSDNNWVVAPALQNQLDEKNEANAAALDALTTNVVINGQNYVVSNKGFGAELLRASANYNHYVKSYQIKNVKPATAKASGSYEVHYYCNLGYEHDELTQVVNINRGRLVHSNKWDNIEWGTPNPDYARDPSRLFGYLPVVYDHAKDNITGEEYPELWFDDGVNTPSNVFPELADDSALAIASQYYADATIVARPDGVNDYTAPVVVGTNEGGWDVVAANNAFPAAGYYYKAAVTDVQLATAECLNGSAKITVTVMNGNTVVHTFPAKTVSIPARKTHDYHDYRYVDDEGNTVTVQKCKICGDVDESAKIVTPKPADPTNIAKATVTVDSAVENGTNQQPTGVLVTLDGTTLIPGVDYVVLPVSGAKEPGKYDVTVNGIGGYTGTAKGVFEITAKPVDPEPVKTDISAAAVKVDTAVENGSNQQPAGVFVTLGGKTLVPNVDYVVLPVSGAKEPGKYDVTINGIGAYTGTAKGVFEITKKADEPTPVEPTKTDISGAIITGSEAYRGEYFNVAFKLELDGKVLREGIDYVLTNPRKNNFKGVGSHKIVASGIGDYTGEAIGYVYITETTQNVTVSPTKTTLKAAALKKKAIKFTIDVKGAKGAVSFSSNNKNVTVTKAGKVTVKKGTKKGTYKVTVKVAKSGGFKAVTKTVTITVK